jgi:hypothetical protein
MVLEYSDLYSVQTPDTSPSCNTMPTISGSSLCTPVSCDPSYYTYEYCRNVKNADELIRGKQLSQMQENVDVNLVYEGDYIKSINLIVGIIGVFSLIFYNK